MISSSSANSASPRESLSSSSSPRELLQKHFDLALDAPDGIKKLRELILTLAMQGKLVPQDPKDQPASELLKEIEAEKRRLVKEGKIKKGSRGDAEGAEIRPEDVPYAVPAGWEWVRLELIASIQTGKKDVNEGHENGLYPFFSCAMEPLKSNDYSFDCEALLLPGNGANVGQITYYYGKFEAYQRTYILSDFYKDSARFIEKVLDAFFLKSLEGKQYGSAINYIKMGNLTDFMIPLPPLAEQKRIVAKIDQLMVSCDVLEELRGNRQQMRLDIHTAAIHQILSPSSATPRLRVRDFLFSHFSELYSIKENVAELRKAILQLAVMGRLVPQDPKDQPASELLKEIEAEKRRLVKEGKIKAPKPLQEIKPEDLPYEVPVGWAWVRLNNAIDVRDGTHDSPKDAFGEGTYPLVTSKNFDNGIINFSNARQISTEDHFEIQKRSKVETDDILFSMIGGNIGNQVVVRDATDFSVKNVAIFKYYSKKLISPLYIKRFSEHLANSLQERASGGAQPFVSLGVLRNLLFPLSPLAEQKRIVAKIDQLMALCDSLEQGIEAATKKQTQVLDSIIAGVA